MGFWVRKGKNVGFLISELDKLMMGREDGDRGVWGKRNLPFYVVDQSQIENQALMNFEVDLVTYATYMRMHCAIDNFVHKYMCTTGLLSKELALAG
jgi:hypothetical protein